MVHFEIMSFALIKDNLKAEIQNGVAWCMLFSNDAVLISQTWKQSNINRNLKKKVSKSNELKTSESKTINNATLIY